ncbi:helix-turn-helix domain-containing protein, partial [Maritalea sp.]
MTTPEQLRAARALLGLSQDDIANKIGSSSKTVRRAESGPKQVSESTV